jgi:hypothetical protein
MPKAKCSPYTDTTVATWSEVKKFFNALATSTSLE